MLMTNEALDSRIAWIRLAVSLVISTIGGVGLWSVVVVLPVIEKEFGIDRGGASLPYMATMLGFAAGSVMMGRFLDRHGITRPLMISATMLCVGYLGAASAQSLWQFLFFQCVFIGALGSSVTFGPLIADVSKWFQKRRGIAVAIVAGGSYLAGTVWPPILQPAIEAFGWRATHAGIGLVCLLTMLPLTWYLSRQQAPDQETAASPMIQSGGDTPFSPRVLQLMLIGAGLSCCIAMSMPQVHIVAFCGDLGYGSAHGAQMLSLMLGFGVVSRLISGMIADKIGGVGTLLIGSTLQCIALMFYLPFNGLASLYIVSALFGLSQGGIVPSYALIVRDYFPVREAGTRISLVLTSTIVGMALGGWMSGEIYDYTGSYRAAFLNGIAFNFVNMSIAMWLLLGRSRRRPAMG